MTRTSSSLAIAVILLGTAAAMPAMARPLPAGGVTAQEVADWLHSKGYPAEVKADPTTPGDQIISSVADGTNYDIYMYSCTKGRCRSLQYAAGWTKNSRTDFTAERINDWDANNRYIRAYIGDEGSLWAEYDIDVDPGWSYEALDQSLTRWQSVVDRFKTFFKL